MNRVNNYNCIKLEFTYSIEIHFFQNITHCSLQLLSVRFCCSSTCVISHTRNMSQEHEIRSVKCTGNQQYIFTGKQKVDEFWIYWQCNICITRNTWYTIENKTQWEKNAFTNYYQTWYNEGFKSELSRSVTETYQSILTVRQWLAKLYILLF